MLEGFIFIGGIFIYLAKESYRIMKKESEIIKEYEHEERTHVTKY